MMFLCLTGWTTFIYTLSGSTHVGKFLLYLTNYYFSNTYFIVSYCLTAQINVRRLVVLHLNSSESWSGHFCVSLLAGRQPFEGSALFGFVHRFPSLLILGPYQRYKNVCDLSPAASSFQLDGYRLSLSYDLFRLDHCTISLLGLLSVSLCSCYNSVRVPVWSVNYIVSCLLNSMVWSGNSPHMRTNSLREWTHFQRLC